MNTFPSFKLASLAAALFLSGGIVHAGDFFRGPVHEAPRGAALAAVRAHPEHIVAHEPEGSAWVSRIPERCLAPARRACRAPEVVIVSNRDRNAGHGYGFWSRR